MINYHSLMFLERSHSFSCDCWFNQRDLKGHSKCTNRKYISSIVAVLTIVVPYSFCKSLGFISHNFQSCNRALQVFLEQLPTCQRSASVHWNMYAHCKLGYFYVWYFSPLRILLLSLKNYWTRILTSWPCFCTTFSYQILYFYNNYLPLAKEVLSVFEICMHILFSAWFCNSLSNVVNIGLVVTVSSHFSCCDMVTFITKGKIKIIYVIITIWSRKFIMHVSCLYMSR